MSGHSDKEQAKRKINNVISNLQGMIERAKIVQHQIIDDQTHADFSSITRTSNSLIEDIIMANSYYVHHTTKN